MCVEENAASMKCTQPMLRLDTSPSRLLGDHKSGTVHRQRTVGREERMEIWPTGQ